ncbi:MAG: preprotein translocase subunit SecY [Puniceicoccales bacterium]|jgi:preprotein translocase subunit SecY|nr:preprotein translocase subunit SecY [Puniceicoccales bacterium]
MFSAFLNCLKIQELRNKIVFTFSLLFIARIGASIPLPGIDPKPLHDFFMTQRGTGGSLVGMYNMFTGGAFLKGAVFGLGVMPYISASIILQLLAAVAPSVARIQREQNGRQRIAQYTRYLTLVICLIQGMLLVLALSNYPEKIFPGFDRSVYGDIVIMGRGWFLLNSTIILTAGTMILTWLGDRITQLGIGNGVSLLITAGILSSLPGAVMQVIEMFTRPIGAEAAAIGIPHLLLMLALLVVVIYSMVAVTQATRKIPVQYARRVVGRKMIGGQNSFLPLKVNYAGVMPVIFASTLIMFPQQIFTYIAGAWNVPFCARIANALMHGSTMFYVIYGILILCFSYFWVSIMFKPMQIAEDLKKNGGYIPGVRPGNDTADFLDFSMTRLTLAGAIFLTVVALLPDLISIYFGIPYTISMFFGGTGTLITVGVILDTMRQMEIQLLERNYDGFLQKGKVRARGMKNGFSFADFVESCKKIKVIILILTGLLIVGFIAWLLK